jgi:hypothetical protein
MYTFTNQFIADHNNMEFLKKTECYARIRGIGVTS